MSRRTRVAAEAIASAVILAALLWLSDPRKIWDTLSGADGSWVLGAIVVNTLTVPLMAFRWKLLLSAKGIHDVSTPG